MSGFGRYGRRGGGSDGQDGIGAGGHHGIRSDGCDGRTGQPLVRLLGERYRLIEQLGAGGMSVVWRGYDEVLGRQVAVKVLASRLASERALKHRIRIEAKAAARLCHQHITGVYDYGEAVRGDLTVPYVVMELIDGESLHARLAREGALPWRSAAVICAEVASALAAAHLRGVVHRDVTPGNVMLTTTGVKVVDFGISALAGERDIGPDGSLLGTPAYLAPERLDGAPVSPATDVYALGLLLYKTLTGHSPWQASTTTEMLRAHLYTEPTPLPPVPGLPEEVAGLCRRCLAKVASDRPTSAEVAQVLFSSVGGHAPVPVSPTPAGPAEADGLAGVGTTILPSETATGTLSSLLAAASSGRRTAAGRDGRPATGRGVRRSVGRRPLEMAAVGVGLIAVTGLVWSTAGRAPANGETNIAARPGMAVPEPTTCEVDYVLRRDNGRDFDAELRLRNAGPRTRQDWQLSFTFPADQSISGVERVNWQQRDGDVLLQPTGADRALAAGASVAWRLTGSYASGNPLPVEFQLDDQSCRVQVSGVPGSTVDPSSPTAGQAAGTQAAKSISGGSTGGSSVAGKSGGDRSEEGKPNGGKGRGGKGRGGKGKG